MVATTMDDELFRALRDDAGMPESAAEKVARLIFRRDRRDDEFVTKTERKAEREVEREAARAVREAERATDREAFAEKGQVTVLQTEMLDVKAAIVRIDKSIERIDATLVSMQEMIARLDERMNGLESQNRLIFRLLLGIFVPLHLLTLGALIGLLTRGILWGIAP